MASKTNQVKVEFNANTSQFTKAISDANRTMTTLRSELKLNKTQMDATGQSVEGLSDRQRILKAEAEASAKKVDALSQKLEAAKSAFGENSVEAQRLTTQLNNARTAQERIAQDIDATSKALDEQRAASAQASSAMGRLETTIKQQESALEGMKRAYANVALEQGKNSTEAKQLASQIGKLSNELDQNKAAMNEARTAADRLGKELDDVGDKARGAADDLDAMDAAAGILGGVGLGAAVSGLFSFSQVAQEVTQDLGQLDTAFTSQNSTVEAAREVYSDFYGLLGESDTATEASNNLVRLTSNTDEMRQMTVAAAGAFAQMGDALPIENLIEGAQETAKTATLTGGLTDAVNWSTKSNQEWAASLSGNHKAQAAFNKALADGETREDAYNAALAACTTEQERAQLIMDSLTMAYGEAGKQYLENNSTLIEAREAQGNFNAVMAEAGEKIMPVTTFLQNLATDGLSWFLTNLPTLTPLITGLGVAIGGLSVVAAVQSGFFGLANVLKPITLAFTGLSAPVIAIVAVFALLAAAFVTMWNSSEQFRTAVTNLVSAIGTALQPVFQTISDFISTVLVPAFTALVENLAAYVTPLINQFATFLQTVVFPALSQFAQWFTANIIPALQQMWEWFSVNILPILAQFAEFVLTSLLPVIAQIAQWILENAVPALQSLWEWFSSSILPILQDFWSFVQANVLPALQQLGGFIMNTVVPALSSMWDWFSSNIIPILQSVWDFISSNILPILGDLAEFILGTVIDSLQGLWSFFSNNILPILEDVWGAIQDGIGFFQDLGETVGEVIDGAKKTVDDGLKAISGFFSGLKLELPKIKLPHFSISGSFSLNPPSIPKIGVEWYAKGGIMNAPTLFGFNGGNAMIGGEKEPEAITPLSRLQGFIDTAFERNMNGDGISAIVDAIEGLSERVISLEIDGRQVAKAIAGPSDRVNGGRQRLVNRGLSI